MPEAMIFTLTCKDFHAATGIAVTKATQSKDAAFKRVAECITFDPAKGLGELALYMSLVRQEQDARRQTSLVH